MVTKTKEDDGSTKKKKSTVKTEKIQSRPIPERCKVIKDIEEVLGRNGYVRFRQIALPGVSRMAYVKDNRVITISDVASAPESQISFIKAAHNAMLKLRKDEARMKRRDNMEM